MTAIEKGYALADYLIGWIDIQPEQPLGRTAERNAQLIDGQALPQIFDIGIGAQAAIVAKDAFDVASWIEHADGMKIQSLGFGYGEHCAASRFRNICRNYVVQGHQRQALARGKRNQQLVQLRA